MRRNSIIAIIVIIFFLLAGVVYFAAHNTQNPAPASPTPISPTTSLETPTQTPSPTEAENTTSYCTPNQLQANLALEPAAGNIYGTFTLKNISSKTCRISGNSFISANYPNSTKNITITHVGEPTQPVYDLAQNQTLYSQLHYPNGPQCSSGTQTTPVTFTYAVSPTNTVTFTGQNGSTSQNVTTCKNTNEETTIQIWNIANKPITP